MAWPFAGSWNGRSAADISAIMAACCRAVNERLAATSQTEILWNYNSGTKTYPTAADLSGAGLTPAKCKENVDDLIAAVVAMATAGGWYETNSYTTEWSAASLATDIGLGTIEADDSILSFNMWERIRQALNRLLYYSGWVGRTTSPTGRTEYYSDGYTTPNLAWRNREDNSHSVSSTRVEASSSILYGDYYAKYRPYSTNLFDLSALAGQLDDSQLMLSLVLGDAEGTYIEVEVDGQAYGPEDNGVYAVSTSSLSLGVSNEIVSEITTSPSEEAFSGAGILTAYATSAGISFDVSGECTDQD